MNIKLLLTLFVTSAISVAGAQESFQVSEAEIALLGLEFSPVTSVDNRLGVKLPARIVAAPDAGAAIISPFTGVISRWERQAGDKVHANDVLAVIRSVDLMTAQQTYLEHWSERQLAQQQFDRDAQLFEDGIISRSRLQQTENQLAAAQSQVRASENLLAVAGLQQADLQAIRAGNSELGQLLVRAPADGTLARRELMVGDYVEANEPIGHLVQLHTPWVSLQVPSRLLAMVDAGVGLSTPDGDWDLNLVSRDHVIDPATQTAEILAQFATAAPLIPGQLINVMLHPAPGALMIPAQAVVHEGGQTLVYVYSGQELQVRPLQLAPVGEGYIAQSGIRAGEQLVVKGAALVKGMQLGLGQ